MYSIPGLGILDIREPIYRRYVYKLKSTRYEANLYARGNEWVNWERSDTFFWFHVMNNRSPVQAEWVFAGRILFQNGELL